MPNPLAPRKIFAMITPSVNTTVQPEFEAMCPVGVTNQMGRIATPNVTIRTEEDFIRHVEGMRSGINAAADLVMTTGADYLILALSLECFWDGVKGNDELLKSMGERSGVGVTMGSTAILAAMEKFGGIKKISLITPHRPLGDARVKAFFEECGFEVAALKSFDIRVPTQIADVTPRQLKDAVMEVDGGDVDAVLQVGTNLAMARTAAVAEEWLGKPVIAINTATYWHALRENGIDDKIDGFGRLLTEF